MKVCRSARFVQLLFFGAAWLSCGVLIGCHDSSGAQLAPSTSVSSAPTPTQAALRGGDADGVLDAAVVTTPDAAKPNPASASATGAAGVATRDSAPGEAAQSASPAGDIAPPLLDAAGTPLPQSDERPTLTSASFQRRVALVVRAIVTGDAEAASSAFFPLPAYQQVKDVAKPERDYKFRLLANFKRDVLEYHRALGASAPDAKFDGITVSEKDAKWMAPGTEGNRVGYFRVLRSRLRFTLPTGRTRDFELTSMISWRGEWYVVHLHGFE